MANKNEKLTLFAKNIAKYRKQKEAFANAICHKTRREHVAKIETGLRFPSLPLVMQMAEVLNIKVKDLFDFE